MMLSIISTSNTCYYTEDSGTDTPSTSATKRHLPSPVNDDIAAKYAKREELAGK